MVDTALLKKRLDHLKGSRSQVESVWDDVERYVMPLSASREQQNTEGVEKRTEIWDFTAIDGCQKFAASIQGSVTSPAIRWFRFGFSDKELQKDNEAQKWLDEVTEIVWNDLQASDFNTEIASSYQEYVGYGTQALSVEAADEEKWKGLDFTSIPIRQVFFEPDSRHGWVKFYRVMDWTPVQVVDRFKDSKRPVPDRILRLAEASANPQDKILVAFCVFKREEFTKGYPAAPDRRPWGYVYFDAETGEQLGDEGGYYTPQVFIGRWEKTGNSVWGHGPAIVGLPTIKYLNAWCEVAKTAAEKAVDPATLVTERGLLSDLRLEPGGLTVVRSMDDVKVHESGARFDVANGTVTELRAMVRQLFHVDELQLKDSPAMTATEVQVRYELMNRVMGSTLARLTSEILDPMLEAVLQIEARAGRLPAMPKAVKRKGLEATVQYQGALSRAQRSDEVAAAERGAALIAAFAKIGFQDAMDLPDIDGYVRSVFERLGLPAMLLRSDNEVKKIRAERQAMQKQMAQAEIAKTAMEAAAKGTQAGVPLPVPAQPTPIIAPPVPVQ